MSASSNVNRSRVMRSRPVADVADRMFTWLSERLVATSDSSRDPIQRLDHDGHDERRGLALRPRHLDQPLGLALQRLRVRAVRAVDGDALAPRDEPDDLVAGHRRAAPAEPHPDVAEARAP